MKLDGSAIFNMKSILDLEYNLNDFNKRVTALTHEHGGVTHRLAPPVVKKCRMFPSSITQPCQLLIGDVGSRHPSHSPTSY